MKQMIRKPRYAEENSINGGSIWRSGNIVLGFGIMDICGEFLEHLGGGNGSSGGFCINLYLRE